MNVFPYLFFNGRAREAAETYARIFDLDPPQMMTMADAPPEMDIPDDRRDWVMHCHLMIGPDSGLMLSDDFTGDAPAMEGSSVMLNLPTAREAKHIFDQLADGGEIRMNWEPTFWSAGFGTCTDRFGIRWMVGCDEAP